VIEIGVLMVDGKGSELREEVAEAVDIPEMAFAADGDSQLCEIGQTCRRDTRRERRAPRRS